MRCGARGLSDIPSIHTRAIKHYDYARESLSEILFISAAIGMSPANKFRADARQSITILRFPRYAMRKVGRGEAEGDVMVARTGTRICAHTYACMRVCLRTRVCIYLSIIRNSIIYVMRIGFGFVRQRD